MIYNVMRVSAIGYATISRLIVEMLHYQLSGWCDEFLEMNSILIYSRLFYYTLSIG